MKISNLYSLHDNTKKSIKSGEWYTPNSSGVKYDSSLEAIVVDRKSKTWNYKASFEIRLPENYLKDKKYLKISYKGKGWFSVKLIESGNSEQSRKHGGSWKKLVTVREAEFVSLTGKKKNRRVRLKYFYPKPFNVDFKAFLAGFKTFKAENIASCEITVRQGSFHFFQIEFE